MKALFYLDPESDHRVANTMAQWADSLLQIHHALKSAGTDHETVFLGHTSAATYFAKGRERFVGVRYSEIDELVAQCNAYRVGGCESVDRQHLSDILKLDFTPDVVIAVGDAKYLECVFPQARILHVEMSPFYRLLDLGPRFCVTFTDRQKLSDVVRHRDGFTNLEIGEPVREALAIIKAQIHARFHCEPVLQALAEWRKRYQKVCLVPLAEPWFSPLRIEVGELIAQLLAAADPQELFILVDHPLAQALTDTEASALQSVHANLVLAREEFPGLPTQSFYAHCQVVYTDFSNAALDSLFFDGLEYRSALTNRPDLRAYQDFRNPMSSSMNALARCQADAILYALLKYYSIPAEKFFNAQWWNQLLAPWTDPISFAQIEARLA